ncbi:G-protein coupled receptor Mth2 [Anthophora quadrimaculata]
MFKESVVIALLYVYTLVHCAHNNTESSREFLQKCCFDNADTTIGRKSVCHLSNFNKTSAMISYDSLSTATATAAAAAADDDDDDDDGGGGDDMSCCTACFENTFEMTEVRRERSRRGNGQECVNIKGRTDVNRSCLKVCLKDNGETVRIWKVWSYNGSNDGVNNDNTSNATTLDNIFCKMNELRGDRTKTGEELWHCDSVFTSLNFWGAKIVIFANIIYIIPYLTVVLVYLVVPGLDSRAYSKAVICYNASQLILNGLIIMFLTISSTFWLFVICIDMTLVITRFRSTSSANNTKARKHLQERKKFFTYAAWTWGCSLLPTALACIAELSPLLSPSSSIRPNFQRFQDGANLSVIIYVATFPILTCLANSVLFCYTSYRMILIQKSTTLATANSATLNINKARKRYFLFLRLYFLMDAPWITSALAAAFTELWVLKFLRMIQPILMLLAILPPRTISRIFACNCLLQSRIFTFGHRVP